MPLSLALGVLVVFVLSVSSDAPRLLGVLERFKWTVLPLVVGLALANYGLRFVKWQYYLSVVGIGPVSLRQSATIFVAGLSMVITPGKVGEFLKSYLLRYHEGVPIGRSAPIIMAERLTDGIAMVLLASGGLLSYGVGREIFVPLLGAMIAVLVVSQNRRWTRRTLDLAHRLPIISSRVHHLEAAIESAYQLFRLRPLFFAIALGVVSWGCEAVAFYLVLTSLGLAPSLTLAVNAAFILSASSLVGAASMLPGGLAAADGSLAGLLLVLGVTHDVTIAAAATILIRFTTLWLGVAIGLVGLGIAAGQLHGADLTVAPPPEATRT
jgi:glycosyltransferase 2 family protein